MQNAIYVAALFALLACSEAPTTDAFKVSDGILVVDATALRAKGVDMAGSDGQSLDGIVEVQPGLSVKADNEKTTRIGISSLDLAVFDLNGDKQIDDQDAPWDAMYLAVDYNRDGAIGEGEYALIGECGVNAISIDASVDEQAWSIHTKGEKKAVTLEQKEPEAI